MKYFILIGLILGLISCQPNTIDQIVMPKPLMPERTLNVGFLIVDGVYNSELVAPMDILHHTVYHTQKGMKVFTVAQDSGLVTSFEGLRILPDYTFNDINLPNIDILIVPSAEHSMDTDLENVDLINFVRQKGEKALFVMSLCDGAFVLAKTGLVNGKESTTFPSDIEKYRLTFPELVVHDNISFVHDGNLITSVGGAKSYDPALYLAELLYGKKAAEGLARGLVINWDIESIDYIRVE